MLGTIEDLCRLGRNCGCWSMRVYTDSGVGPARARALRALPTDHAAAGAADELHELSNVWVPNIVSEFFQSPGKLSAA